MIDYPDSLLIHGSGGSGKTSFLLEQAVSLFNNPDFADQAIFVCASAASAEEFRDRLRRLFLQSARENGDQRLLNCAFLCQKLRIFTPENPFPYEASAEFLFADDFDRFPGMFQESLRNYLAEFSGKFHITSSPDCLPVNGCKSIYLTSAHRADFTLRKKINSLFSPPFDEGKRQDNSNYSPDKFIRFIPISDATQRASALKTELARLKRRRDYERNDQEIPRISIVCQTTRQQDWLAQTLSDEDIHLVGDPPCMAPAGRLLTAFLRAALHANSPEYLYLLADQIGCAPNPTFIRHLKNEYPDLVIPALHISLNRRLKDWENLRAEALIDPVPAMEKLLDLLCPSPAMHHHAVRLLHHLNGGPQACLHRLEELPYGTLPPLPDEIFLSCAGHPDLPAADYLLLPFVARCEEEEKEAEEHSQLLLRRVLTSCGRSLSVLTCGKGEPNSWQEILERGLNHAADR